MGEMDVNGVSEEKKEPSGGPIEKRLWGRDGNLKEGLK